MLNKELLLAPTKEELAYTHIVTVSKATDGGIIPMTYIGYASIPGFRIGAMSPNTLLAGSTKISITVCANVTGLKPTVNLETDKVALPNPTTLWLGRPNTYQAGKVGYVNGNGTQVMWYDLVLFTEEDIGKEIPIWLSYERPPWYDEHSGGVEN